MADREIDVLTPLGAALLTGRSTEAVRVATVQGHVRIRGVTQAGKHPVRLIDLKSALSYWDMSDDHPKVERMKEMGGTVLEDEDGFRYRILTPAEFVAYFTSEPACPHGTGWPFNSQPCTTPPCSPLWFRWD